MPSFANRMSVVVGDVVCASDMSKEMSVDGFTHPNDSDTLQSIQTLTICEVDADCDAFVRSVIENPRVRLTV